MTPRTQPAKVKLCATCRAEGVWRYDEDNNVTGKCPTCFPTTFYGTPDAERDAALAGTSDANPEALRAAVRIIRDCALSMPQFSSNDTRHAMTVARVPGPTIGAAFRQAAKDGVIRRIGYVTSTDPGTHAHPVVEWSSLIFRGAEGRTA